MDYSGTDWPPQNKIQGGKRFWNRCALDCVLQAEAYKHEINLSIFIIKNSIEM